MIKRSLIKSYMPFSYYNVLNRKVPAQCSSILDIGCGSGYPMLVVKQHRVVFAVGADIFLPNIKKCKRQGLHDDYVLCDARFLPFRHFSFDIVICLEIIEHMPKEYGFVFIDIIEAIACNQVIIATPVANSPGGHDKVNPYDLHKSIWLPKEFTERGYEVRGVNGPIRLGELINYIHIRSIRDLLGVIIPYLFEPLVFMSPHLAWGMFAVKMLPATDELLADSVRQL
jgi:SAM-dependent methyltransferase